MAKAINWPKEFREEVLAEDTEQKHIALRLGSIYYENRYWVPDEVIDIRVDHKKIRTATVVEEMRQCPLHALTPTDLQCQKARLQNQDALIQFLGETYQQDVNANTLVTVVCYRNRPIVPKKSKPANPAHSEAQRLDQHSDSP